MSCCDFGKASGVGFQAVGLGTPATGKRKARDSLLAKDALLFVESGLRRSAKTALGETRSCGKADMTSRRPVVGIVASPLKLPGATTFNGLSCSAGNSDLTISAV